MFLNGKCKHQNTKSTDGRVVQGGGLKTHYRKMRGFEPLFVHSNITHKGYSKKVQIV